MTASIKTERLLIREVADDDFDQLLDIYNCRENMQFISNGKYDWSLGELKEKYQ